MSRAIDILRLLYEAVAPITGVGDGRKTVTLAGTAEPLGAPTIIKEVTISAELDNEDIVVVGGSTVIAALNTRRGTPLHPGDAVTFKGGNLADFFVDVLSNEDGVTFTYLK